MDSDITTGPAFYLIGWGNATFSGVGIVLAVMSVNFIGDWLRDALDPGVEGEGGV